MIRPRNWSNDEGLRDRTRSVRERRRREWSWSVSTDITVDSSPVFFSHTEHVEIRDVAFSLSPSPSKHCHRALEQRRPTVSVTPIIDRFQILPWMDSFFHRVSSIVIRGDQQAIATDLDPKDNERQRKFKNLQRRRLSAPDIHRRAALLTDRTQKGISSEQINADKFMSYFNTSIFRRRHHHSNGRLNSRCSSLIDIRLCSLPWWRTSSLTWVEKAFISIWFSAVDWRRKLSSEVVCRSASQLVNSSLQAFTNERCRCLVSLPVRVDWRARFLYFMSEFPSREFTSNDERTRLGRCVRNVLCVEQQRCCVLSD